MIGSYTERFTVPIEELKAWALEWAEDLGARIHDENA
jgi:hypothetical protein